MYQILTHKKVDKFLEKHKQIARQFVDALEIMQHNPFDQKLDISTYHQGGAHQYRPRIGKYRFLYEIIESKILIYVYDAGNRGDIYK